MPGPEINQGRPSRAALDGLIAEVYAFAGAEPRVGDITLLLLQEEAGVCWTYCIGLV